MKTRRHCLPFAPAWICLLVQGQLIGQVFRNLYSFTAFDPGSAFVNNDGGVPLGGIVISSNALYGTTLYGATSGEGTVFSINLDGTGFTLLYTFAGGTAGKFPTVIHTK